MPELKKIKEEFKKENSFQVYELEKEEGWLDRLIEKFAPIVQEYYSSYKELEKDLDKLLDEDNGFGKEGMKKFLNDCLKASIPSTDDPRPENFRPYRSDFPEILASLCLQELFKTEIPVDGIKSRELQGSPGRGIDIVGYETNGDKMHLILCEVKGTTSPLNPPKCVTGKEDSMDKQLLSHIMDRKKTLQRLISLYSKAPEEKKPILAKIMFLWNKGVKDKLKIFLCPFLVRESSKYKDKDYTFMKKKVKEYSPGIIRFLIVCINGDLNEISKKLYETAPNRQVAYDD